MTCSYYLPCYLLTVARCTLKVMRYSMSTSSSILCLSFQLLRFLNTVAIMTFDLFEGQLAPRIMAAVVWPELLCFCTCAEFSFPDKKLYTLDVELNNSTIVINK